MMARYFHGGYPGLKPGDLILPPDQTGTEHRLSATSAELGAPAHATRTDVVYLTTGRDIAKVYAAFYPDGALYEVQPDGDLHPDPDCTVPGVSYQAPAARILRVTDPAVLLRTRTVDAWIRLLNRATDTAGQ
ncbi:hypothetical protein [Streptomyces sp. FL07-04A]|uniref:hypothetical protein n=1 Tax=Streptomyces sp. FL07-04A TaxID=3028658 RepID=UPI0029B8397E|nr:hypothetical protein [Streptomyces sp. FL07-04A]MDX3575932.1 hypothetical protein [Streptomyces sp. FL07-04A]